MYIYTRVQKNQHKEIIMKFPQKDWSMITPSDLSYTCYYSRIKNICLIWSFTKKKWGCACFFFHFILPFITDQLKISCDHLLWDLICNTLRTRNYINILLGNYITRAKYRQLNSVCCSIHWCPLSFLINALRNRNMYASVLQIKDTYISS